VGVGSASDMGGVECRCGSGSGRWGVSAGVRACLNGGGVVGLSKMLEWAWVNYTEVGMGEGLSECGGRGERIFGMGDHVGPQIEQCVLRSGENKECTCL